MRYFPPSIYSTKPNRLVYSKRDKPGAMWRFVRAEKRLREKERQMQLLETFAGYPKMDYMTR